MKTRVLISAALLAAFCFALPAHSATVKETVKWAPVVQPKPLTNNVKSGLAWLAKTQLKSGGWSQGEESSAMGNSLDNLKDKANVADTCIAALALIRSGSTPSKGQYAGNVRSAVNFVCAQVEESDAKSLSVTDIKGTRVQMKLGPYIDTFMASMLLTEAKGKMPTRKEDIRIEKALNKVLTKIAKNQREDGTWTNEGWAPVLSQSMATRALNSAAQKGMNVDEKARERAETYARKQYDGKSGSFKGEGSAGVQLYSAAGNLSSMQQSATTNAPMAAKAEVEFKNAKTDQARKLAKSKLDRYQANDKDLAGAQSSIISRMDDKDFISGFGSNGGEEFLSYMNIGESLVVKGGKDWKNWDRSITDNLNRIQNQDGTWTGHHCITGRTFCTAAALMVLTTDRAPVPVAGGIKRK